MSVGGAETDTGAYWAARAPSLGASREAWEQAVNELTRERQYALAEAGCEAAFQVVKGALSLRIAHAELAFARKKWAMAFNRWQRLYPVYAGNPRVVAGYTDLLVARGQAREAEDVLNASLPALLEKSAAETVPPRLRRLLVRHVRLALARGDHGAASARLAILQARAAQDDKLRELTREVDEAADGPAPGGPARVVADGGGGAESAVLQHFESLGGHCEFGLVQRKFELEPLGLLRWVSISTEHLLTCLATEFAGVGEEPYTIMRVSARNEFMTLDTRYHMQMHSFIKDDGQDRARFLVQMQRRLQFLRRKLLEDLAAAEKCFIYRAREDTRAEDPEALAGALQRYNPANRLLFVWESPAGTPATAVEQRRPGLFVCTVARGKAQPDWNIDFAGWTGACQQVLAAAPE